jgi:hypothetical protein
MEQRCLEQPKEQAIAELDGNICPGAAQFVNSVPPMELSDEGKRGKMAADLMGLHRLCHRKSSVQMLD